MALIVPGSHARSATIHVLTSMQLSRGFTTLALLSTPRKDVVDWVKATSSFFEGDSRPIMLFDGNSACLRNLLAQIIL